MDKSRHIFINSDAESYKFLVIIPAEYIYIPFIGYMRNDYFNINSAFCRIPQCKARAAVKAAIDYKGPVYIRFGRLAVPVFNNPETYHFEMGKGVTLRDGKDLTIVATGLMVWEALVAAESLAKEGIDARVINIHTLKPLDEELVVRAARETGKIVTVEEHSVIGGLGSAVCDAVSGACPCVVKKIGVEDSFGMSGPAVELLKKFGLSAENIVEKVRELVR